MHHSYYYSLDLIFCRVHNIIDVILYLYILYLACSLHV